MKAGISSSLSINDLKEIVKARDAFFLMDKESGTQKSNLKNTKKTKAIFSRSITLNANYPKGTVIKEYMILMRKPGSGITQDNLSSIVGKKLSRDYDSRYLLTLADIETS